MGVQRRPRARLREKLSVARVERERPRRRRERDFVRSCFGGGRGVERRVLIWETVVTRRRIVRRTSAGRWEDVSLCHGVVMVVG
jgi:hypothetical protein